MDRLTLTGDGLDENHWNSLFERVYRANLFQSWHFGAAMEAVEGHKVHRLAIEADGKPVGLMQVFEERRMGVARFLRLLRGPVFFQPTPAEIHAIALKTLKKRFPIYRLNWVTMMPELPKDPGFTVMQDAGLSRIMEGYETVWMNLRKDQDKIRAGLDGKWRNQLKRAEGSDLQVQKSTDPHAVLAAYEVEREKRGYSAPSAKLLSALPDSQTLALEARLGGEKIAAIFIVRHGKSATYQAGWTSEEGRRVNAHNLLLWHAIIELQQTGIADLDLGGIDPARQPGIAHFKQGLGGERFENAGVYM